MALIDNASLLITDKKEITKQIALYAATAKSQDELLHLLGCSIMKSFLAGSPDLANILVSKLGRSADHTAWKKWFNIMMPCKFSKEGNLAIDKKRLKEKDFKGIDSACTNPFWNFKVVPPVQQFTLKTLVASLVTRAEDRKEDACDSSEVMDKTDIDDTLLQGLIKLVK